MTISSRSGQTTYGYKPPPTYYGNPDAWNTTKQQPSTWGTGSTFGGTVNTAPTYRGPSYSGTATNDPWDWFRNGQNNPTTGTVPSVPQQQAPMYSTDPGGGAAAAQQAANQWSPQANPGTPVTGYGGTFTWSPPDWLKNQTQEGWGNEAMMKALQSYGQLQPWVQTQQNAMQYGMDFNEAQRRWNQQFGWQQSNDQFSQGLANRQQQMAENVARLQQGNWEQQFGLDRQMGLGQLDLARQQNAIDEMFKRGQLSNEQYANESNRLYQQGQLGIGNRELDVRDWYQREQVGIAQQQNAIDQMFKSGQLSNQQRELALGELTQRQNEAYRYAAMQQEAALSREQMANQQRIANMNAFGRVQTPNARFIRSWGS